MKARLTLIALALMAFGAHASNTPKKFGRQREQQRKRISSQPVKPVVPARQDTGVVHGTLEEFGAPGTPGSPRADVRPVTPPFVTADVEQVELGSATAFNFKRRGTYASNALEYRKHLKALLANDDRGTVNAIARGRDALRDTAQKTSNTTEAELRRVADATAAQQIQSYGDLAQVLHNGTQFEKLGPIRTELETMAKMIAAQQTAAEATMTAVLMAFADASAARASLSEQLRTLHPHPETINEHRLFAHGVKYDELTSTLAEQAQVLRKKMRTARATELAKQQAEAAAEAQRLAEEKAERERTAQKAKGGSATKDNEEDE